MAVWAFSKVDDFVNRSLVFESIRQGKSRFGWSQKDEHNLLLETCSEWHSKQLFLLEIKPDDWIVHINTPEWGQCTAVKVVGCYEFDDGINSTHGVDFRHAIPVDVESICVFNRRDDNVLPSVNLRPRSRYHRVYEEQDFYQSIANLRDNKVDLSKDTKGEFYLKDKTETFLPLITSFIQQMNKSKDLEVFLAKVFRKVEGVVHVKENGSGWRSDNGADLIVTFKNLNIENKVVVQVKSFEGSHHSLEAVSQIENAINVYGANAGLIITTASTTEILDSAIQNLNEKMDKQIDLMAGEDVARFVLKYAPEMVFKV
ncbi:restriction endonuclease [Photobacterium leiognathi subsp. mandapamensis]|uniref:restriction endonuclease n=1 Tax=Photobacterium leiognathi TaxID=553611 RepID=UPI000D1690C2|nr:restriction endonuclease [Photobacterium leiognathi]PSU98316.1 restriction endonuclease [Photobacterium leiognathi subsp. mandapamensis]